MQLLHIVAHMPRWTMLHKKAKFCHSGSHDYQEKVTKALTLIEVWFLWIKFIHVPDAYEPINPETRDTMLLCWHFLVPSYCLRSFTKKSGGLRALSLCSVSVTEKPVLEISQRGTQWDFAITSSNIDSCQFHRPVFKTVISWNFYPGLKCMHRYRYILKTHA